MSRPLSKPGRAPRTQPLHHALVGHSCAFVSDLGVPAIELGDLLGGRIPGIAVDRGELSDQLGNGQTEFGRSHLELVRSVLVDLDADVAAHGTRIADPETVSGGAGGGGQYGSVPAGGRRFGGQPSLACQP